MIAGYHPRMGYIPQPTPAMGPYSVEVRRESFYLRGDSDADVDQRRQGTRHGIFLYPDPYPDGRQGTVEILLEDIPKVRAALDLVEQIDQEGSAAVEGRISWVTFAGQADDVVEIGGAYGADPGDPHATAGRWPASAGGAGAVVAGAWDIVHEDARLRVNAIRADGMWSFAAGLSDLGGSMPLWPMRLERSEDAPTSAVLVVEVPSGARVEPVAR